MEFLVPTLWVAKELGWHENDFSNLLDDLEKLKKDRVKATVGIYVEKQRRKQWYDTKVWSKHFQMGDLVLLYTLKKNKWKLKKHGLGPYVINELLQSGCKLWMVSLWLHSLI